MEKIAFEGLAKICPSLTEITNRMARRVRWEGYPRDVEIDQSPLHHSVSVSALAAHILSEEVKHGTINWERAFKILVWFVTHDWGEGLMGDMTYKFKKHPIIRAAHDRLEGQATEDLFKSLPVIGPTLRVLREGLKVKELELIDAIEKMDYMLTAIAGYQRGHHKYLGAMQRQQPGLEKFSNNFLSIKYLYGEMDAWVRSRLFQHGPEIRVMNADVAQVTEEDVAFMEQQLKWLKSQLNGD